MEIITIYGEIERWKIFSEGQIYSLEDDSLVYPRTSGWFQLERSGKRWKLHRILRESRAEVYPDWNSLLIDEWIDFVSLNDRHEYALREEIERRHIRPFFHENPISKKFTLNF